MSGRRAVLIAFGCAAATLVGGAARADPAELPNVSLSGFGTFSAVRFNQDLADFGSSIKSSGAGFSRRWSANVDSLAAVQATALLTPELSAVLQIVSEQDDQRKYRPHVEWANVKYQVTPELDVRVGRTVLPVFLISDTRKVGYTFAWIRPPLEVYDLIPLSYGDGIDATYQSSFGEARNRLQLNAGQSTRQGGGATGTIKSRDAWGIGDTLEYGSFTAHAAYERGRFSVASLSQLLDAFRQLGPEGRRLADHYDPSGKTLSFYGIGASYEPGDWFLTGEAGHVDSDSTVGKKTGWYLSGGYRFGNVTPYATYARATADNLSDPGLDVSSLPPELAPTATALNAMLNGTLSRKVVQRTISVGARWDVLKNASLKVQFDDSRVGSGSTGTVINVQPGFVTGGRLKVFSAGVDFTF